jgi:hypothetical protein
LLQPSALSELGLPMSHLLTSMDLCSLHNTVHNVGPFNAES